MELIQIEKNMRESVNKIEEIGASYAIAKGVAYHLTEMRKVVLAREMKNYTGSIANREMEARASQRYEEHILGVSEAITEETRLRAEYEKWRSQYESCRSLLSIEKAKINIR